MIILENKKQINIDNTISIGPFFEEGEPCGWRLFSEEGKILTYYDEPYGYVVDVKDLAGWGEKEE